MIYASRLLVLVGLMTALPLILAQTCDISNLCPETAPCCSEYGYCGIGTYCLGGCEPLYSFNETSCLPEPACQSGTSMFTNLSRVQLNATAFNGNVSAWDWVLDTGNLVADPNNDGVRLILNETNGGTLLSSTRYVHYGTIDFVLQTSKWTGVVTAAITMSDVKDEIDWEWPGNSTTSVQSNYYFLGIANYSATEGEVETVSSDTAEDFHTYTLDWQVDSLSWIIDGTTVRTVNKNDTLSSDGTQYKYPSTPSRIQISIWPAGISTEAQGTVDWAGGFIDWEDPDYITNGYFYNTLQSVTVKCSDDSGAISYSTGYEFVGNDSNNIPIVDGTNRSTMLASRALPSTVTLSGLVGVVGIGLLTATFCAPLGAWSLL